MQKAQNRIQNNTNTNNTTLYIDALSLFLFTCISYILRRLYWIRCAIYPTCYDVNEAIAYINFSAYAQKPYFLAWTVGKLVSFVSLPVLVFLCDLSTSFFLQDKWYLLLSSFIHPDATAIITLLASIVHYFSIKKEKRYKWVSRFISSMLGIVLLESTASSFIPGINLYWYINIQMHEQYRRMHEQIFMCTHLFLWTLSWQAASVSTQLFVCSIFKECGFRGYILIWRLLSKSKVYQKNIVAKAFYFCESLSSLCSILIGFIWWSIHAGSGNMNFLCWATVILILSTGATVLMLEILQAETQKEKQRKQQER